ncbi:PDK repeat-containing protein [Aequorivita sublithincola DSM 14238]|uniref:PDK repeat-containing protein n=1 Tax=Aequorivita sublithincola (strain DSM 14238 / LMG 21431 / ACAM 643 / 9-3) TaxID=746697 RepID=I3YZX2_AEQSU|nr:PKD domain-containing protein [Aequorivita sublithincola]AFL82540.1 PDK repeat-containing protein [Aequorivita sublithincola DSM 14238]
MKKIIYLFLFFTCFAWSQAKDDIRPCTLTSGHSTNQIDCDSYQFTATSTGGTYTNIIGYYWNFGDGTSGTGQTVSHNYNNNGTYTVILTTIGKTNRGCCSTTECFTVSVNCIGSDCGTLFNFSDVAGNGNCDVLLIVSTNDYILDPGWTIITGANAYEWHLVNQNNNIDRYEYGGPSHFADLTDGDIGPWTITLKITLEDGNGNFCALEHTETLMSGCGGNQKIIIHPNPVNDFINVTYEKVPDNNQNMEIYDYSGLKIRDVLIPKSNDFSIDVSDLKSGIYFMKIFENDQVIKTEKFIKE